LGEHNAEILTELGISADAASKITGLDDSA